MRKTQAFIYVAYSTKYQIFRSIIIYVFPNILFDLYSKNYWLTNYPELTENFVCHITQGFDQSFVCLIYPNLKIFIPFPNLSTITKF